MQARPRRPPAPAGRARAWRSPAVPAPTPAETPPAHHRHSTARRPAPPPQADKAFLQGLRAAQEGARLADDEAAALVKDAARARVEGLLEAAVQCVKQRTRVRDFSGARAGPARERRGRRGSGEAPASAGWLRAGGGRRAALAGRPTAALPAPECPSLPAEAMAAMTEAVAFNRGLAALAGDAEVALPGLGPTSVLGGDWEKVEGRNKDVRELFRCARDGGTRRSLLPLLCLSATCWRWCDGGRGRLHTHARVMNRPICCLPLEPPHDGGR